MLRIDGRHDAIATCLEGGGTTRPICSAALISNGVLYVGDRFLLRLTVANALWKIGGESRGLRQRFDNYRIIMSVHVQISRHR
jgi:hypothetical protein